MTEVTAGRVVEELRLTPGQVLALRALQARMLLSDSNAESNRDKKLRREATLRRFVQDVLVEALPTDPEPNWGPWESDGFQDRFIEEKVETFTNSASTLAGRVIERSASLVIVVELLTFSPWDDGTRWDKKARQASLELAAAELGGLRDGDLQTAIDEFERIMKALRRKSIKWGRVAAATAVGAGIGVLTAGWAAPAIGGVIGGTMGLTGAAATSARAGRPGRGIARRGRIRRRSDARRVGYNRDKKSQLNEVGRRRITWLWRDAELRPNVLLQLPRDVVDHIFDRRYGTQRTNRLFRAAEGMIVHRNAVATVSRQLGAQKRVRYNGGARSALAPEGYLILSGAYHRDLASRFGVAIPRSDEYVSVRVVPAGSDDDEGILLRGRLWRRARQGEPPLVPAPKIYED